MGPIDVALIAAYGTVAAVLGIFALHRIVLACVRARAASRDAAPGPPPDPLPFVTVQLPVYNEATVVERLVEAVSRLDWPRDRLEIQILDDSTDETRALAARAAERARARGVRVEHLSRADRTGYKAGALAHGLRVARGALVAVFDADFVPWPDFLRRAVPHFSDPAVGLVQARWGHLNRDHSLLTRLQALLLDGHFEVEQVIRHRCGLMFNFNGTAGVWRRSCIDDAGGWQHDTLTEDMDLSYRAQLSGWRFVYLNDLVVPAELPVDVRAFKSQQHRWAKGALQTARKLLGRIWRSGAPRAARVEAAFHLLDHVASVALLVLTAVLVPALLLRRDHLPPELVSWISAGMLGLGVAFLLAFYGRVALARPARRLRALGLVPLVIPLYAGLGPTIVRAVLGGLFRRDVTFRRTPKYDAVGRGLSRPPRYRVPLEPFVAVELALCAWHVAWTAVAVSAGWYPTAGFLALFALGYLWVGAGSLGSAGRASRAAASRRLARLGGGTSAA